MAEFQLEFATRQIKRAFARAIGKSIPKILTELITNADDSYRRLQEATRPAGNTPAVEEPAPITIVFERSKRRFSVIDHAEGLTDKEMQERFVTYGQESSDRARGFRTRSLFGKGLRDVLFTQYHGQVKSIKNDLFHNCRFRWKDVEGQERPFVDIKAPSRITPELRKALGIPANGTLVEFQLAEGVHNPQPAKLLEDLCRFYMLRMINSSPHRDVILKVVDARGKVVLDNQVSYRFPEIDIKDRFKDQLLTDLGTTIEIEGEIGLADHELTQGEVGYIEREGGLLVLDEDDAVLDLHLFGFDEDPAARRLSGTLRLRGAGTYIRAKLNQKEPEEILTETRDGFEKNLSFYRGLRDRVQPRLQPLVAKLRELGPEPKQKLSERIRERHQQALDILNKLASEILGRNARVPLIPTALRTPPPQGIAFASAHVSVQASVNTPAALLINTALVQPNDQIQVTSDGREITVSPGTLIMGEDRGEGGLLVKIVRIRSDYADVGGKITAVWKQTSAVLDVTTTAREVITPVNGLEFDRDEYSVRVGARRHLRIFIDVDKVSLGSEIELTADRPGLRLVESKGKLAQSHLVTPRVAQIDLAVAGVDLADEILVTATSLQFAAGTRVSVAKRDKQERGKFGLFKDYKFQALERKVQSLYVPDGVILINTKDPVNVTYFGEEPYRAVEEEFHCQVRLADLILNECLWILVSQALESGKLDRRFPNNPEIDVRNYVDEKKFEIGPQIHSLFVGKAGS
jgi:hypothetical protein